MQFYLRKISTPAFHHLYLEKRRANFSSGTDLDR